MIEFLDSLHWWEIVGIGLAVWIILAVIVGLPVAKAIRRADEEEGTTDQD
jgi:hypothetical protein